MWSTRKELQTALAQVGLEKGSPRLAAAARHAIILEPDPVEDAADTPIGACRLGGTPDLPSEVPWPWRPPVCAGKCAAFYLSVRSNHGFTACIARSTCGGKS
jgi:hypothetical protein